MAAETLRNISKLQRGRKLVRLNGGVRILVRQKSGLQGAADERLGAGTGVFLILEVPVLNFFFFCFIKLTFRFEIS